MKNLARRLLAAGVAHLLRRRSRPFPFHPGVALVVAPHADDETLGCGGLLALKRARGDVVHVVFVTDSAGSPEEQLPADLAARRQAEALAALQVLGLDTAQVHFLGAPDGHLNRLNVAEATRFRGALAQLIRTLQPAEIFVPYFGGGSSEHDATVELTQLALSATHHHVRLWEYPVWAWWDARRLAPQLRQPAQNYHLDLGPVRARKQAALDCHASQVQPAADGQPPLPPVLATLCTGPVEFFFHRQT